MDIKPVTQWHMPTFRLDFFFVHKRRNCYHIRKPFARSLILASQPFACGGTHNRLYALPHDGTLLYFARSHTVTLSVSSFRLRLGCCMYMCMCMCVCCHFYTKSTSNKSAHDVKKTRGLVFVYMLLLLYGCAIECVHAYVCVRVSDCLCIFVCFSSTTTHEKSSLCDVYFFSFLFSSTKSVCDMQNVVCSVLATKKEKHINRCSAVCIIE